MISEKKIINKDIQLVIRKSLNNIVEIDELQIIALLEDEYNEFIKYFEVSFITAADIIDKLNQHSLLNALSKSFNYCIAINKAFQGIPPLVLLNYPSDFPYIDNDNTLNYHEKVNKKKEVVENQLKMLEVDLNNRLSAYRLEKMYEVCFADPSILSFSHRKRGWSIPKYYLTENFSFELKTNFGYGSASYFYTKIQYKEIDILPYSDWINYKYANLFEIISASSKHGLQQQEWVNAFDYVITACRLAANNEKGFIEFYIIKECENLVEGLQNFLIDDKFKFTANQRIYTDNYNHGENLIEFKAHKISGSIDFISCIFKFSQHIDVSSFIDRIINFNEQIQPILIKEIKLTNIEIKKVNKELKVISENIEKLKPKFFAFKKMLSERIKSETNLKENEILPESKNAIEQLFSIENPEYMPIKITFEEQEAQFNSTLVVKLSLEKSLENMITYNTKIKSFVRNEKFKYKI